MHKKIFFGLLILYIVLPLQAQYVVKGKIVDINKEEVPFSTIQLLGTDSVLVKGCISDSLGIFTFPNVQSGKYIVRISNVGYSTLYKDIQVSDSDNTLASFVLDGDDVLLDEVIIRGNSLIRKKDHVVVIPDKIQKKHAYSGYDLLYNLMIPGLNVNANKGVVKTARGEATLYINGVKAELREIQNLRPKDIEKVEYYDIPSGIYIGDIASINYVTKTYQLGGYVSLDGWQNIGYLSGNYNLGAKLDRNKWSYTFFGGYGMNKYNGIQENKTEKMNISDSYIHRTLVNQNALLRDNQQYAQFKVNYKAEKYNIYALTGLVGKSTPENNQSNLLHYENNTYEDVLSLSSTTEKNLKPSVCVDGIFYPTSRQRIHINITGNYAHNTYSRIYTENKLESFTHADEDLYSFRALGVYNMTWKNSSLGVSFLHDHHISSSLYEGDYRSWQHLWRGESLLNLSYMQHLFDNKITLMINPGLSLLNYKLHTQPKCQDWTFRTNSWIRYQLHSNHQFSLGFAMGNFQPDISYVNTADQTIDFLRIQRGNPNLANPTIQEYFFTYDATLNPVNLQINSWHTRIKNNVSVDYYSEGEKLISSYLSNTTYDKWKLELIASCRISDKLRINSTLKYEKFKVAGGQGLSTDNFMASLQANYFIKSFTLSTWSKSTEKTLDSRKLAVMKSPALYGISLRYNKANWMAEMGTENPFTHKNNYREYSCTNAYQYEQSRTSRIYQQTAYVKLAYTFDFGKKTSREFNSVDRSINSAILKAE